MDNTTKALLYLVFALTSSTIILAWISAYGMPMPNPVGKMERYGEGVYYTRFGGVYCGSIEVTPCGINLRKCIDERVYLCLHDLSTKEEFIKEEK